MSYYNDRIDQIANAVKQRRESFRNKRGGFDWHLIQYAFSGTSDEAKTVKAILEREEILAAIKAKGEGGEEKKAEE